MNTSLFSQKSPPRKHKYPIHEQASLLQELESAEERALAWELKAHEITLENTRLKALLHQHGLSLDGRG